MTDEEDLYDDLYEDVGDTLLYKAPFQSLHENATREEEKFKKKEVELINKVESLLKEVEALKQDKAVLTRNMSCLFKTAQMELARKDKQMKELRDENLRLKLGGTTNLRPHLTKAQVPADKTSVGMDSSEERNRRRPDPLESAGVSTARIHEHRGTSSDGSRRAADGSYNKQRSSSFNNSCSDGRREMGHAEYGHSEHRSRDRSRDSSRDGSRDHRDGGDLRNSDNRKRHRSYQ